MTLQKDKELIFYIQFSHSLHTWTERLYSSLAVQINSLDLLQIAFNSCFSAIKYFVDATAYLNPDDSLLSGL